MNNTASPPLTFGADNASLSGASFLILDDTTAGGSGGNNEEEEGRIGDLAASSGGLGGSVVNIRSRRRHDRGPNNLNRSDNNSNNVPNNNDSDDNIPNNNDRGHDSNNNNSWSPTRSNIQLEISTEDGGSMNIQREVTLETVSLTNTTADVVASFENAEAPPGGITSGEAKVGHAMSGVDGVGGAKLTNIAVERGDKDGVEEASLNDHGIVITKGEEETNLNGNQENDGNLSIILDDNNTSHNTTEEDTSFETTSIMTNSMSVITDVIDNYGGGSGYHHHHAAAGGGKSAVLDGGDTSVIGAGGAAAGMLITGEGGVVASHSSLYDAVASFLSGGGSDATPSPVATATSNNGNGGATTTTAAASNNDSTTNSTSNPPTTTNNNNTPPRRRRRKSSNATRRKSMTEVDMLTGLVLDDENEDDKSQVTLKSQGTLDTTTNHSIGTLDTTTNHSIGTRSVKSSGNNVMDTTLEEEEGCVKGSQVLVNTKKKKNEEYTTACAFTKKDQVEGVKGGYKEQDQVHEDQHQGNDDEVRNSNSDEYYYQNAHSHENHHHSYEDHGEEEEEDVREDSLVLDTLSSDWLPPSSVDGPSGEEGGSSKEGGVMSTNKGLSSTLSVQSLLGTSVKSLMDESSSTDSSGGMRSERDSNLVPPGQQFRPSSGGEFMDVPHRSPHRFRRKPQRSGGGNGGGGATPDISSEGMIPATSTSTSSQDPLQRLPSSSTSSSTSSSSAQRKSAGAVMDGSSRSSGSSGESSTNLHQSSSLNSDMMALHRGLPMTSPTSRNSDMMELQRGFPLSSPMAGDASRTSDMMELHRGLPMSSPMAGDVSRTSDMMELQRGLPMSSPMAGDASRTSDMMELQRGLPMSSPMAGDSSRTSDMMELQRGQPMPPGGRAGSIDESMNSRMMNLQPGVPMGGEASTNSAMMELQHGLPMSPDRSESPEDGVYEDADHQDRVHSPIRRREEAIHTMAEALSLHHQNQSTPENIIIDTRKPQIPDSYPSLMDALQSGSSFGSSITAATQSYGITMPNQTHRGNEREYIDHEAEEILNVQDDDEDDKEGCRENSLTYTEFYNTQQPYHGADQVVQAASLPSSSIPSHPADGNADPRMDIDYQRHYIVDLHPINEEGTNASRSGVTSRETPPRDGAEMNSNVNNMAANLHQVRQQQVQPAAALTAANLQQQQQYHPMAPATAQPNDQFFNYRHQYYQERYQDDNETAQTSKYDDDTYSTCSSVTLSQAFQGSDIDSCESSVGLNSSVSSITFSHVDQHEHDQGFFIATKLGDFVQVPEEIDTSEQQFEGDELPADANLKTTEEEKFTTSLTTPTNDTITTDNTDEVSDTTAAPTTSEEDNQKQVGATADDMASDLFASIVPECGVPIPSVMAKVGTRRRKSSNTGFLVPWHSSRSIQNYHFGNQRKKNGRQQRNSSNSSLFSIGSVHTFRG